MKKHFLSKLLTILLIASMILTMLPVSAMAYYGGNWNSLWESIWGGSDDETADEAANAAEVKYEYNIFFLDCGRKYYSVDSIKQLIDNASAAGFNYIQLAVGNDGLRLLLDDMELKVNGTTYDSDAVKAAIHAGNLAYNAGFEEKDGHKTYGPEKNELTESEMNAIIAYANTKGMGVIPCVNTPGHMDAILSAATSLTKTTCSYNGSARTIDVTNETAVAFTKALLQKYITYFKSQGCQLFNMGADEYANDIYTGGAMGFGNLQDSGNYRYYVTYVNAVAAMIKKAGMKPMAFNDGIYYGSNTSSGEFDKDIIICYWSNGWPGYEPMPAATLANMGFKLVNTHGDYYWVLGKTNAQCDASKALGFDYKSFQGSTIDAPAGSMFCIWADYPGDETEASVISKTADTIKAFGGALPKLTPSQPEPGITIKPEGGTTGKLDSTKNESIVLDAGKVVTWSYDPALVMLTSADAPSEVALANLETLRAQRVTVTPVAGASGTATITAADENGNSATFPIEVVNSSATADVTVELKVGQTSDKYTVEGNVTDTDMKLASNFKDVASYTLKHRTETPVTVDTVSSPVGEEVYIMDETGKKYLDNTATWTPDVNKAAKWYCRQSSADFWGNSFIYLELVENSSKPYLKHLGSGRWGVAQSSGDRAELAFNNTSKKFTVTEWTTSYPYRSTYTLGTPVKISTGSSTAYTDITFHGVGEGTTYVTIGGTRYTINVSYYVQPVNVVLNQNRTVTVSGTLNTGGLDTNVATVSVSTDGTTMTVNGKAEGNTSVIVGNTKYLITVSTEDLEAVNPLKIEYWITNAPVKTVPGAKTVTRQKIDGKEYLAYYSEILAANEGVNTPDGISVASIAPESTEHDNRTIYYWHSRMLDTTEENTYGSKNGWQTCDGGDDETDSGVAFTKIRYYNGNWEVFTEKSAWVKVEEKHQLVAYYKEYLKVTDEVESYAADWGNKGDGAPGGWLNSSEYCTLSIQVIYEDGTTNPTETTAAALTAKSFVYGYWSDNKGRGIGTVILNGTSDYEIVRVSAETGEASISLGANNATKITSLSWDNNEMTVWQGDNGSDEAVLHNPSNNFETDGTYANLAWDENKEAILLRVYVRAKVTEDSLTVNYYDESNLAKPFYNYNIAVANGTYFNSNIALNNPWKGNLKNGTVTNIKGVDQTVSADLSTMPAIGANYRYMEYNCTRVEPIKDESGHVKTVNLYYTFTNKVTFVADFGLPIRIPLTEINDTLKNATITGVTVLGAEYGTVNADTSSITYTPTKVFGADAEALQVSVKGQITVEGESGSTLQKSEVTYQVYILPASNVLYEENFLTESNESGLGWTEGTTVAPTTPQQTQKANGTGSYNVFGYDAAYNAATAELGVWKIENLEPGQSYPCLSTTFYGNGFDLIGNCSPTTGRVLLLITDLSGKGVKAAIVDTRYNSAGENGIYQVPLAHLELEEGTYIAEVRASGLTGSSATRSAVMQASSLNADIDEFASVLAKCGLTMADVEFIEMSSGTAKPANRVPSYYAASVAEAATFAPGTHVEIDGFRVYRSTTDAVAMNYYPANEQRMNYQNIIKVMANKVITAYSDNGVIQNCEISEYQKQGGPKKEIYLKQGQSISFDVQGHNNLQVSLRAVTGSAQTNVVDKLIATNTEMYYTIRRTEGLFTISNIGEGILAIGNVKLPDGAVVQTVDDLDEAAVFASVRAAFNAQPDAPDQGAFAPEIFNVGGKTTRMFRNKIVTLRVKVSADVDYVTIDNDVYRTNKWTARLFGYSTITVTKTVRSGDSHEYSVVAYNAQGQASAAKTWGY